MLYQEGLQVSCGRCEFVRFWIGLSRFDCVVHYFNISEWVSLQGGAGVIE